MNNATIIGNLTRDPELKFVPSSGKAIATFTVAVQKKYKKEEADFIPCQVWGNTAEKYVSKYAKKGTKIAVSGELHIDTWKDKEGNFKSKTYINANDVEILFGSMNDDYKDEDDEENLFGEDDVFEPSDDDDIPF